jgi:hypothetical protein
MFWSNLDILSLSYSVFEPNTFMAVVVLRYNVNTLNDGRNNHVLTTACDRTETVNPERKYV